MINGCYANELAREFKIDHSVVTKLMRDKKVPIIATVPYGKGKMTVFDRNDATKVLREHMAERERVKEAAKAAAAPAVHMVDISALEKRINVLSQAVEDLLEVQQVIREQNELLKKQNQEIFRVHTAQKEFLVALADQFGFKMPEVT